MVFNLLKKGLLEGFLARYSFKNASPLTNSYSKVEWVANNVARHCSGFFFSFERFLITSMELMHCFDTAPIFNQVKIKIKYWCSTPNYLQLKIRPLFTIKKWKIVYDLMRDPDASIESSLFISRCLVRWKKTLTFALLISFVKMNIHVIIELEMM